MAISVGIRAVNFQQCVNIGISLKNRLSHTKNFFKKNEKAFQKFVQDCLKV